MKSPSPDDANKEQVRESTPWYRSTLVIALIGAALIYASFPPLNLWPLAWVATVPWLLFVQAEKLPGRRPYAALYVAGFVLWMILVQWVRLGHWAAHFGWIALCLYLAAYLPVFVGLSRIAVHRLRLPLVIAAPLVWVGLEVLRGWVLTGFSMALLAHTQVDWPLVIQISDLFGAYAVSFALVFVAACVTEMLPRSIGVLPVRPSPDALPIPKLTLARRLCYGGAAFALVAAALGYGYFRLHQTPPGAKQSPMRAAIVQGSIDTVFGDPTLDERTWKEYYRLTGQALGENPDVVLWPESTLPLFNIERDSAGKMQAGNWFPADPQQLAAMLDRMDRDFRGWAFELGRVNEDRRVPLLLGGSSIRMGPYNPKRFNSALFISDEGKLAGVYHKMHPVMFGEYAPGGKWFPWIYELMPIPDGLTPGERPEVFAAGGLKFSPTVCYENTVPHLVRRQVAQLRAENNEPDVLVTLSNDGWFWGSAELDMHLACGRFRAVELRKPALIAANTGISAHVDGNGSLVQRGPRREAKVIIAEVVPDGRTSLYARTGDLFGNTAMIACGLLAVYGFATRRRYSAGTN
jgi:apolipoprotein N-acyltransferase